MAKDAKHIKSLERLARRVFLVNFVDNPDAGLTESSFTREWAWIKAPPRWKPQHGIDENVSTVDAIIVFSTKYEERRVRKLCEAIRDVNRLDRIPLLVAVNQFEMPLANRVKELPNADFIFTPVKEDDLVERLGRLG